MNISSKDCDNIAIVVVGYNRINSLRFLMESLNKGNYKGYEVPLVISIDASGNEELYSFVNNYYWRYGRKYVNIEKSRLGLKKHILQCGDLTECFRAIILLEDDLYVSPDFYRYASHAIKTYGNDESVAQIALYRNEHHGYVGLPITIINNGYDVFAKQEATSWGECWNKRMWSGFRNWLSNWKEDFSTVDIYYKSKTFERAWGKYYDAYLCENHLYSIVPYLSLSTNCGDAGEHSGQGTTDFQVELQYGHRDYLMPVFEELVRYDAYYNYVSLVNYLDVPSSEICLDMFGDNPNFSKKRYVLSINNLNYKIIKSFGLILRPIELNVINNISGRGIYLYDTSVKHNNRFSRNEKCILTKYYLRGFSVKRLIKYIRKYYCDVVKDKLNVKNLVY